jgi:hypothetical protein
LKLKVEVTLDIGDAVQERWRVFGTMLSSDKSKRTVVLLVMLLTQLF